MDSEFTDQLRFIFEKLDRIDKSIRGNGKLGINVRLDRLEQSATQQSRMAWVVIGSAVVAIASAVVAGVMG